MASATQLLFERLEEELAALPGVTAVTASMVPLLAGSNWGTTYPWRASSAAPTSIRTRASTRSGPGYFATLGMPCSPAASSPRRTTTARAASPIVNEAFSGSSTSAATPSASAWPHGRTEELDIEIVGIVRDAKYSEVKEEVPPLYFTPWRQDDASARSPSTCARTDRRRADRARRTRRRGRLDPNLPVES
jgi:hypothetical protein